MLPRTDFLLARLVPMLILLLAYILRLYRLGAQSIWWDEGHSIFVASHPLTAIPTHPAMDVHPPGYFALLHLWMGLGGQTEFALRYLSVIFSMLFIALMWRFAGHLTPPQNRRSAQISTALLTALAPLYITYAQEVRGYALLTMLATASTLCWWQSLRQPHHRASWLGGYILLTAASFYTHYFTLFLLLFHNLIWLLLLIKRWRGGGAWLGSQLAIAALFGPQLWLAIRQVSDYANPNLQPPPLRHYLSHSWQAYTTGLNIDPTPWLTASLAGLFLLAALNLLRLPQSRPPALMLLTWLGLPLLTYFAVLQLRPSFEPRYLMLSTPAIFLIFGLGLSRLPRLAPLPMALILLIFGWSLHSYFTAEQFFKDDAAAVAAWLTMETTPHDLVLVDVPHPFHYYAPQIPAPTRYLFVDIHTAAETLNQATAQRERLFWVTWYGSDTDPRGVVPFLAQQHGRLLGQRDFRGYRAQWYSLNPAEPFRLPPAAELSPRPATFGEVLQLTGASYGLRPPQHAEESSVVWAILHFRLQQDTMVDYRVSVRLRPAHADDADESPIIAQDDRDLLNDRHFRTSAWPLADPALNQTLNVYLLPLPPDAPPGPYQLEAVLYNAQPPYPSEGVSGPAANTMGTAAIIGQISPTQVQ